MASFKVGNLAAVTKVRHDSRFRNPNKTVMTHFCLRADASVNDMDIIPEDHCWLVGDHLTIANIGWRGRMVLLAEGGMDISNSRDIHARARRLADQLGYPLPYKLIPKKIRS